MRVAYGWVSVEAKVIHRAEKGETTAMLLSPSVRAPSIATSTDSPRYQKGSQFTMFLTTPVQAFCSLVGISGMSLTRFIFCRTVLAICSPTFNQEKYLPSRMPHLPDSVGPDEATSQSAVLRLAEFFGTTEHFAFSEGIVVPEPVSLQTLPEIITSLDIHMSHLSETNDAEITENV